VLSLYYKQKKDYSFTMIAPGTIILLGMKHSGKTTLGKLLAESLNRPFLDTDDVIRSLSGKSPRELWDSGGAALMQEWETAACEEVLAQYGSPEHSCVLATGGGIADNEAACGILSRLGITVYLDTDFSVLFKRVQQSAVRDGRMPPFLQGPDPESAFKELFSKRTGIYAKLSQVSVKTGQLSPAEISRRIMDLLTDE